VCIRLKLTGVKLDYAGIIIWRLSSFSLDKNNKRMLLVMDGGSKSNVVGSDGNSNTSTTTKLFKDNEQLNFANAKSALNQFMAASGSAAAASLPYNYHHHRAATYDYVNFIKSQKIAVQHAAAVAAVVAAAASANANNNDKFQAMNNKGKSIRRRSFFFRRERTRLCVYLRDVSIYPIISHFTFRFFFYFTYRLP